MDVNNDSRPAPTTPNAQSAHPIDLSTPRPLLQPRDPPAPPWRVPASTHWSGHATGNLRQSFGPCPLMINNPFSTPCQGLAPATNLTLIQHNSLGSSNVILSLFSSQTEGPPPDMVLLQDPPSSKGFLPSFSGFKSFAPPVTRPKVACYVSQDFLRRCAVLPSFPPETDDFMTLDVSTPQGCFGTNFLRFTIGNAYARPLPTFSH